MLNDTLLSSLAAVTSLTNLCLGSSAYLDCYLDTELRQLAIVLQHLKGLHKVSLLMPFEYFFGFDDPNDERCVHVAGAFGSTLLVGMLVGRLADLARLQGKQNEPFLCCVALTLCFSPTWLLCCTAAPSRYTSNLRTGLMAAVAALPQLQRLGVYAKLVETERQLQQLVHAKHLTHVEIVQAAGARWLLVKTLSLLQV